MADSRIQSVIVTAPKDLMQEIAGHDGTSLDVPSDRDQGVYVFQMKNGDPQQAVQVLQNMFQSSSTSRSGTSSSSQNSALQQRAAEQHDHDGHDHHHHRHRRHQQRRRRWRRADGITKT